MINDKLTKKEKEIAVKVLQDLSKKLIPYFHTLDEYFDYYEDNDNAEPVRAVRTLRKIIFNHIKYQIEDLNKEQTNEKQ
jgi:hypothetical protein